MESSAWPGERPRLVHDGWGELAVPDRGVGGALNALGRRHRPQLGVRHLYHALGDVLVLLLVLIVRFADSKSGGLGRGLAMRAAAPAGTVGRALRVPLAGWTKHPWRAPPHGRRSRDPMAAARGTLDLASGDLCGKCWHDVLCRLNARSWSDSPTASGDSHPARTRRTPGRSPMATIAGIRHHELDRAAPRRATHQHGLYCKYQRRSNSSGVSRAVAIRRGIVSPLMDSSCVDAVSRFSGNS